MEQLIPAGISLLQNLLGTGSVLASPVVSSAITFITAAAPIVVQEYKDLKPVVSNIIAALKADPSTSVDELKALMAAEVQIDADFEAAATAALAEDATD